MIASVQISARMAKYEAGTGATLAGNRVAVLLPEQEPPRQIRVARQLRFRLGKLRSQPLRAELELRTGQAGRAQCSGR